jgi:hypothetical protein
MCGLDYPRTLITSTEAADESIVAWASVLSLGLPHTPAPHQSRMERLWNVMKKGLLAGDTLR